MGILIDTLNFDLPASVLPLSDVWITEDGRELVLPDDPRAHERVWMHGTPMPQSLKIRFPDGIPGISIGA